MKINAFAMNDAVTISRSLHPTFYLLLSRTIYLFLFLVPSSFVNWIADTTFPPAIIFGFYFVFFSLALSYHVEKRIGYHMRHSIIN